MTPTIFSKLSIKEQTSCLLKIQNLKYEQNWQAQLELLEKILTDDNTVTRQNRQLWYYRAVALDMLARPSEAIAILKVLIGIYPLHSFYSHSLFVSVSHLTNIAVEKFKDDKANLDIEVYYNTANDNNFCAWSLTEIYLDHLLLTQQTEKAKLIVLNYVLLSPFDANFLEKALFIASSTNDVPMLQKMLNNVQLGLGFHPSHDALATLLTQYFGTGENVAS